MCPECIATVPAVAAGLTFTGAFTAFLVRIFSLARRASKIFDVPKRKEKES